MPRLATVAKSWEQLQGALPDGHLKDISANGVVGSRPALSHQMNGLPISVPNFILAVAILTALTDFAPSSKTEKGWLRVNLPMTDLPPQLLPLLVFSLALFSFRT